MSELNENDYSKMFEDCGAVQKGHFVYTSGRHGEYYVNKDMVIAHPLLLSKLCRRIARHFSDQGIEIVVAPAVGGVALTQWVAYMLSEGRGEVLAAYAEKDGDKLVFKRQYDKLIPDRKVLLLEDIVTTGGSLQKLMEAVHDFGGRIVGAALLWNRGGIEFEMPVFSLVNKQFVSWAPAECPLCQENVPINNDLGHGKK